MPSALMAKKAIKYGLLRAGGLVGREPFTALNDLDRKLLAYLPERNGVFIEAGANDGFSQSNTYYLEQRRGWTGLLIEPVPQLATFARRVRRAPVEVAALGPPEQAGQSISFAFQDLMSRATVEPTGITAPVLTLSQAIDKHALPPVDLLSLDLEGAVPDALRGLDLSRHRPRYMLLELAWFGEVWPVIGELYELTARLSGVDCLFGLKGQRR